MFRSSNNYTANNLYKKYGKRTFNTTENITNHINNYSNDITNSYRMHKINNVRTRIIISTVTLLETEQVITTPMIHTIYPRITIYNITDNQYFTKKLNNTSNTTNNITRHNHNNYDNNVLK